jgi:hypothetical protein
MVKPSNPRCITDRTEDVAQHRTGHVCRVPLEETHEQLFVALAHLAQHPACSLVDQVVFVVQQGVGEPQRLVVLARTKAKVAMTAIRRSQTDGDRASRSRIRYSAPPSRCAPTMCGAETSTRSQPLTWVVFFR